MNILFDGQVFSFQEYGGISRYYSELIKLFLQGKEVRPDVLLKYSNNKYISELGVVHTKTFFPARRFRGRNEIIRLLNQSFFKNKYRTIAQPDIFHPTYYHPYFLDHIGHVPFVLTIYDMAHEMYPDLFHPLDFTIRNKKILASRAARIIAISEHTKNDVVKILGVPASSIDVIPLATDIRVDTSMIFPNFLPEQFILYVGARNTYKNFIFFLRGVRSLINDSKNLFVICAGGGKFSRLELKEIDRLGISDKIIQMNVSDGMLALLYSKTKAFVYPSLYEGFGIPVIEAFSCGAPVVLSDRSSLPEVGGDAAVYFDPENIDSLEFILRNIILQKDSTNEMIRKGFERSKIFSWQKTADKTTETYKKILRKS